MIDSKASGTAILISRATLFWSRDPQFEYLVPPEAASLSAQFLKESGVNLSRFMLLLESRFTRFLVRSFERLMLPGISIHFMLRKRFIEDHVRIAITQGAGQVVVLGAGFDTLAARLHREYEDVLFVEIDHPATQRVKVAVLSSAAGKNLRFVPADLSSETFASVLARETALRSDVATVVVAEGLLMYLQESMVMRLFDDVRSGLPSEESTFVFTFMERDGAVVHFTRRRRLMHILLQLVGEPFRWGVSEPEGLVEWLRTRGFAALEVVGPQELRERYVSGEQDLLLLPPDGDTLCVASAASVGGF